MEAILAAVSTYAVANAIKESDIVPPYFAFPVSPARQLRVAT
jgi:hypothetical protein